MQNTRIIRLVLLSISVAFMALPSVAQQLIASVPVGAPSAVAVNSATNKIYVGSANGVTVIDGGTFSTLDIPVPGYPSFIAVNEITNKIYVCAVYSNYVVQIDGATDQTTQLNVQSPDLMAVNPVSNKIYVISAGGVTVIDGATLSTLVIPLPNDNFGMAVNQVTNKIYVTNFVNGTVTVIDGLTNSTTTISGIAYANLIAVNPYTNKIYVTNGGFPATLTVIDGATLSTTVVDLDNTSPYAIALNPLTNKIYLAMSYSLAVVDGATLSLVTIQTPAYQPNALAVEPSTKEIYLAYLAYDGSNGLLAINGETHSLTVVATGGEPGTMAVDSTADRIYVTDGLDNTVWVVAGPVKRQFVPLVPCRVVDTRNPDGQFGGPPISGGTYRDFPLPQGNCNIPANAAAYSLNVTVVPQGTLRYLTVWPSNLNQPLVSTMNSLDGRVKANAAIIPAGGLGAISIYVSDTTNVVVDVNGYFQSPTEATLAFYPLPPCRVADTRGSNGPLGGPILAAMQERDFPILASACGIPATAQAYSFNLTAVPRSTLGYLTVWPTGQSQPVVSTLNAPTGTITANAAIVPAGQDGEIAVFPSDNTDLVIDVSGYFAPPATGGMSLNPLLPCRVLDTRTTRGAFSGTILVDVVDSGCGTAQAGAYVLNATVVPGGPLGYLTVWPTTEFKPLASTLNAIDGAITSNMVIVPNIDGWLDVFASNPTNLIIDSFSYFAP